MIQMTFDAEHGLNERADQGAKRTGGSLAITACLYGGRGSVGTERHRNTRLAGRLNGRVRSSCIVTSVNFAVGLVRTPMMVLIVRFVELPESVIVEQSR